MTKGISKKIPATNKQGSPLKKTMLALCVGVMIQPVAYAQDATVKTDGLEEITVYGVRASLRTAQELKRNADTHVDAISATDIGALPDVSVLEALHVFLVSRLSVLPLRPIQITFPLKGLASHYVVCQILAQNSMAEILSLLTQVAVYHFKTSLLSCSGVSRFSKITPLIWSKAVFQAPSI
jgi:hypothetical protein